jgi:hypothetical protein
MKSSGMKKHSFLLYLFGLFFSFFFPSPSFAQEFTARTVGDYDNVTVMQVTGNYNAKKPDGSVNSVPRQVIAKEFFRTHKDEYDFLVIFSTFDFEMPEAGAKAFYLGVRNDTLGIGRPIFDNSESFGSKNKLQGTLDMGNVTALVTDPLEPKFGESLDVLDHEILHRWAASVKFKDSSGNISSALLGKDAGHWSFLLNSYGSVLYGNQWQDNGNGTFTSIGARKYYSPLDLYLMGFYDKSQVPPMLLIENPAIDPTRLPEVGATIEGTPRYVSIDDIIAAEGERLPGPAESQKTFKTAFILITTPETYALTMGGLTGLETFRKGWATRFSVLTDGQGLVQIEPTLIEDIPTNPGVPPPVVTPRTLPPNIDDGVRWLMNSQRPDGSWKDLSQTTERDTAETVLVLKNFGPAQQNYSTGLQWLSGIDSGNMDYLSRKIEVLINSGQDTAGLLNELLSRRNSDGGWGSNRNYMSNPMDTSVALKSLAMAGYQDASVLDKAIGFVKAKQNADGGWGSDDEGSSIQATANVLAAFKKYQPGYSLDDPIAKGIAWLLQRQNGDGGFGNSPSTVYDTSMAVLLTFAKVMERYI